MSEIKKKKRHPFLWLLFVLFVIVGLTVGYSVLHKQQTGGTMLTPTPPVSIPCPGLSSTLSTSHGPLVGTQTLQNKVCKLTVVFGTAKRVVTVIRQIVQVGLQVYVGENLVLWTFWDSTKGFVQNCFHNPYVFSPGTNLETPPC